MSQFFALTRRRTESFTEEQFKAVHEYEAERVRTLYSESTIRQIWRRGDMPGACIVLEADSLDAARALVETLPLFQAGMLEIMIVMPLTPYHGFGPRGH